MPEDEKADVVPQPVVVVDFNISFGNLIGLWFKVLVAGLPVGIVLGMLWFLIFQIFLPLVTIR